MDSRESVNKEKIRISKNLGKFDDKPTEVKKAPREINHEDVLNQMLKAIKLTPMEDGFKAILILRLTSTDPSKQLLHYATKHGIRFKEILEMEQYAKDKVKAFLKSSSLDDIVQNFNQNSRNSSDLIENVSVNLDDIQAAEEKEQDEQ